MNTVIELIEKVGRLERAKEGDEHTIRKVLQFLKYAQNCMHQSANPQDIGTAYTLVSAAIMHLECR